MMNLSSLVMRVVSIWAGCTLVGPAGEVGTAWRRIDGGHADRFSNVSWEGPTTVGVGARGLLATSDDGKSWLPRFQWINADLKDLAWNGSHYVAVGSGGTVLRSADGLSWQSVGTPGAGDYSAVTWTGTEFLALDSMFYLSASSDGLVWTRGLVDAPSGGLRIEHFDGVTYLISHSGIYRSTDLTVWTQVLSTGNSLLERIRRWNGRLFAVGPRSIYSSVDGIQWESSSFVGAGIVTLHFIDVGWNGSRYVAVGDSSQLWTSSDGLEWTAANTLTPVHDYLHWNGSEFILGGFGLSPETSVDGKEWTGQSTALHYPGASVVWTGSRFVTVASRGFISTYSDSEPWTTRDSGTTSNLVDLVWTGSFAIASGSNGTVLRSDDGRVWSPVTDPVFTGTVRSVWTGGQLFAFASNGVHTSSDGLAWTQVAASTLPSNLNELKWIGGRFVGVGFNGKIVTSEDGVTWTTRTSGTTANLLALGTSGSGLLAGGEDGVLLASDDGTEWTLRSILPVAVGDLEHRFGRWFLASNSGIYQSSDGLSWDVVPDVTGAPVSLNQLDLVWAGSKLVCTGLDAETSDGIHWQQRDLRTRAPDFKAVAKGGGGYVAVGAAGEIRHSPDGYSWQACPRPTLENLDAVVAGNDRWVAVGSAGAVVTSPDGVIWTARDSGTTGNLLDIAWNGQRFAAVGEEGTVLTSIDGEQWSAQPMGFTTTISNIEAVGSAFKGFAGNGRTIDSPDGISWNSTAPGWIADVVWNGSNYVAVGSGANGAWAYVSSPDGLEWARHPIGAATFPSGVCWTGARHVACGTGGVIVTSPDGVTWTQRESGTSEWIQAVHWNGAQLVAVGHGGTLLTSDDGIVWTARNGPSHNYEDVVWADGRYVAVGEHNGKATSTDGITWQTMTGSIGTNYTVEWIGTRFLAGGSRMYSSTATQWLNETSPVPATIYDFEWNGEELFAAAADGILRFQETGTRRWSGERVYSSLRLDNMARNGTEYVATGSNGTVVLSRDGSSWRTVAGGRQDAFDGVAWNGSVWVGAAHSRIEVSADGGTWNRPADPLPRAGFAMGEVMSTGSRFVAVGPNSVFLSSPDAESWTETGNHGQSPSGLAGVAGGDDFLVAVGAGGIIMVSDGSEGAADFRRWMAERGVADGQAAPSQDANRDGITNLLAYIFGIPVMGNVTPADLAAFPAVSFEPAGGAAVLTFELRESYRPGVTYEIEGSPDLASGNWRILQRFDGGWVNKPDLATVTETELPGGGLRIRASNLPGTASGERRFFRLRAVLP